MTAARFDLAHEVEVRIAHLDTVDWMLIALGIALLYLTWRSVAGRATLGTIEVAPITKDEGANLMVTNATVELQTRLAKVGLRPAGGVPAGSPTAGLVKAIETAPIKEANWIANLVALLPIPPGASSFRVLSTMRCDGAAGKTFGLTYRIVDVRTEQCFSMDRVWAADTHKAIDAAATAIYREIVAHARDLFPVWAHWKDADALARYQQGLDREALRGGTVQTRYREALEHYVAASRQDPGNMLVRLRIGNCLERLAGCEERGTDARMERWIEALNAYSCVIALYPTIFEPHYRTSVVLGIVADHVREGDDDGKEKLQYVLRTLDPDDLPPEGEAHEAFASRLRHRAKLESRKARNRLRLMRTVAAEWRLRHQFEPTGKSRRQLRKALVLSSMCLRLRRNWHEPQPIKYGLPAVPRVCWRLWVDWRYMKGRWSVSGWQAHYNAAAFHALLPEVSLTIDGKTENRDVTGNPSDQAKRHDSTIRRARQLRRKALAHLVAAVDDPNNELQCAYVRDEDVDLHVLRNRDKARWRTTVVDRLCGREAIMHYRRDDKAYQGWNLKVGQGALLTPVITQQEQLLVQARHDDWGAVFRIPIYDVTKRVQFQLVNGSRCDGVARIFVPADHPAPEAWVISGKDEIYPTPPSDESMRTDP